jgi:hypothetical protein
MSRGEKNYGPCKRDHMREFRTLEECAHDRHHRSGLEESRDETSKLPQGHATHRWSASQAFSVRDERRQFKAIHGARLGPDPGGDSVSYGIDRSHYFEGVGTSPRVMPSADRWHRQASTKLARQAEYGFGRRWTGRGVPRGVRAACDEQALAKALEELA